jgi:hypothetical protein
LRSFNELGQVLWLQAAMRSAHLRQTVPQAARSRGPPRSSANRDRARSMSGHWRRGCANFVSDPHVRDEKLHGIMPSLIVSASVAGPETRRSSNRAPPAVTVRSRTNPEGSPERATRQAARQLEVTPRRHVDLHHPRRTDLAWRAQQRQRPSASVRGNPRARPSPRPRPGRTCRTHQAMPRKHPKSRFSAETESKLPGLSGGDGGPGFGQGVLARDVHLGLHQHFADDRRKSSGSNFAQQRLSARTRSRSVDRRFHGQLDEHVAHAGAAQGGHALAAQPHLPPDWEPSGTFTRAAAVDRRHLDLAAQGRRASSRPARGNTGPCRRAGTAACSSTSMKM